uniref:Uncharacterized protein n=1 Tax=Cyanoderma ruficeps TaxID=181631 RepID=A0A8C3QRZ1_9PASS
DDDGGAVVVQGGLLGGPPLALTRALARVPTGAGGDGGAWRGPPQVSGCPSPLLQRLSSASSRASVSRRALFFSFSFSNFFFHCSAVSSRFTDAVPHLCPNMSVDLVSASL